MNIRKIDCIVILAVSILGGTWYHTTTVTTHKADTLKAIWFAEYRHDITHEKAVRLDWRARRANFHFELDQLDAACKL